MKNHLDSWREKFVHALFRHTCTLIACRNGVIGKNDFTLTKTVTILFVHERGNSVHASRGYAARSVPEFPRSWTNNIVTITSWETVIRISDPDFNPDHAQLWTRSSYDHYLPTHQISSKSDQSFLRNPANKQTNKQTDTRRWLQYPAFRGIIKNSGLKYHKQ